VPCLHSAGAKCHVHQHGVAYDRDAAADERVHEEFAVQVGVARVFGVDSNGSVTEHRFETRGGHNNFIVAAFNFVCELNEDAEFVGAVAVAGHALALGFVELLRIDFNIGDGTFKSTCTRDINERRRGGAVRMRMHFPGGRCGEARGVQSQFTRRLAL
jgi:hypothetical protein